jgi:hypothetical protein
VKLPAPAFGRALLGTLGALAQPFAQPAAAVAAAAVSTAAAVAAPVRAAAAAVDPTPWYTLARAEARAMVRERAGKLHHPRILEYHRATRLRATTDEVPWCAAFICWLRVPVASRTHVSLWPLASVVLTYGGMLDRGFECTGRAPRASARRQRGDGLGHRLHVAVRLGTSPRSPARLGIRATWCAKSTFSLAADDVLAYEAESRPARQSDSGCTTRTAGAEAGRSCVRPSCGGLERGRRSASR